MLEMSRSREERLESRGVGLEHLRVYVGAGCLLALAFPREDPALDERSAAAGAEALQPDRRAVQREELDAASSVGDASRGPLRIRQRILGRDAGGNFETELGDIEIWIDSVGARSMHWSLGISTDGSGDEFASGSARMGASFGAPGGMASWLASRSATQRRHASRWRQSMLRAIDGLERERDTVAGRECQWVELATYRTCVWVRPGLVLELHAPSLRIETVSIELVETAVVDLDSRVVGPIELEDPRAEAVNDPLLAFEEHDPWMQLGRAFASAAGLVEDSEGSAVTNDGSSL